MTAEVKARLDALRIAICAYGLTTQMTRGGIHVENSDARGCCIVYPCAIVTMEKR